jgi:DnaJ-class molecular chaperone
MAGDYYETLGVSRKASEDEIKNAYRKLARQYHPDRNPGDKQAEAKFKEIQEAYDVIGDKAKRGQYDRFGAAGPHRGFQGAGPGGFNFNFGGPGAGGFQQMDPAQAADLFRQFFGGGGGPADMESMFGAGARGRTGTRRRRPAEPQEVESEVSIPFLVSATGGSINLQIDGRELSVKIPPGVEDGQALRLHGQAPGGGDLRLKLRIQEHPYFRREGRNIVLEVPISVAEAMLGGQVEVPTLAGPRLTVKIPPGTSSGTRLRLRGRGIVDGDQLVQIKVVVPAAKDARSKELATELGRLHPEDPRAGLW